MKNRMLLLMTVIIFVAEGSSLYAMNDAGKKIKTRNPRSCMSQRNKILLKVGTLTLMTAALLYDQGKQPTVVPITAGGFGQTAPNIVMHVPGYNAQRQSCTLDDQGIHFVAPAASAAECQEISESVWAYTLEQDPERPIVPGVDFSGYDVL